MLPDFKTYCKAMAMQNNSWSKCRYIENKREKKKEMMLSRNLQSLPQHTQPIATDHCPLKRQSSWNAGDSVHPPTRMEPDTYISPLENSIQI